MRSWVTLALALASVLGATGAPGPVKSPSVVGGEFTYEVRRDETLALLGARFGLEAAALARINGLKANSLLKPAQVLQIDNRHIVPGQLDDGILVNIPQRMLYLVEGGHPVAHYPVGLGRPDWRTPTGPFNVVLKEVDPAWDVPPSIQEEMRQAGKPVITRMPPGPQNPLGRYWIGLSRQNLGVHGTIAPASIYQFQTHGCIRLHPDDAADLFPRVSIGTPGSIVYEPVLMTRTSDGAIWLEAHRDIYGKVKSLWTLVGSAAERLGVGPDVDWDLARSVARAHDGLLHDVRASEISRQRNAGRRLYGPLQERAWRQQTAGRTATLQVQLVRSRTRIGQPACSQSGR